MKQEMAAVNPLISPSPPQGVTRDAHADPRARVWLLPRPLVLAGMVVALLSVAGGLVLAARGQLTALTLVAAMLSVGAGTFLGLWMLPDALAHRMLNRPAEHGDASDGLPPADACPPVERGHEVHVGVDARAYPATIVDLAEARRSLRP